MNPDIANAHAALLKYVNLHQPDLHFSKVKYKVKHVRRSITSPDGGGSGFVCDVELHGPKNALTVLRSSLESAHENRNDALAQAAITALEFLRYKHHKETLVRLELKRRQMEEEERKAAEEEQKRRFENVRRRLHAGGRARPGAKRAGRGYLD